MIFLKLALCVAVLGGRCLAQHFPRQTAFLNSTTTTSSTSIAATGLVSSATTSATIANATTIIDCATVFADTVGLNYWWSSTYELTVATVVTTFIQYNNTVVPANSTTIVATKTPFEFDVLYGNPTRQTVQVTGIPTDLVGTGGLIYAGTIFNSIAESGTTVAQTAYMEAANRIWLEAEIVYANGTNNAGRQTLQYDWLDPIALSKGCTVSAPSTSYSGSPVLAMPTAMKDCILSIMPTVTYDDGNQVPLSSCTSWYVGGQPTVHVPVTQLTYASSVTTMSNANYGSTRSPQTPSATLPVSSAVQPAAESSTLIQQKTSSEPMAQSSHAQSPSDTPLSKAATSSPDAPTAGIPDQLSSERIAPSPESQSQNPDTTSAIAVGGAISDIAASDAPKSVQSPQAITIGSLVITAAPAEITIGSRTLTAGGSAATVEGNTISLASSNGAVIINGVTATVESASSPPPEITIGGARIAANSASQYTIGSQTLSAGGSAVTVDGSTVSLAPGGTAVVVNGQTSVIAAPGQATPAASITVGSGIIVANSASQFVVGSQTLSAGGSAITVDGTTLSLAPGGTAIVANGITSTLASLGRPSITVGPSMIAVNTASQFVIGSQTLSAGGPAITVDGTTLSLAPAGTAIVVNGITSPLAAPGQSALNPSITVGSNVVVANSASQYIVDGQTLSAGGPAIIVDGSTLSLAPSGTAVVMNGVTSLIASPGQSAFHPSITVGQSLVTANSASQFIVGGQTLSAGGPAITIDGTTLSLLPAGTAIVVNGVTSAISTPSLISIGPTAFATPIVSGAYILPDGQTISKGQSLVLSGTTYVDSPSGALIVNGQTAAASSSGGVGAAILSGFNGAPSTAGSSGGSGRSTSITGSRPATYTGGVERNRAEITLVVASMICLWFAFGVIKID